MRGRLIPLTVKPISTCHGFGVSIRAGFHVRDWRVWLGCGNSSGTRRCSNRQNQGQKVPNKTRTGCVSQWGVERVVVGDSEDSLTPQCCQMAKIKIIRWSDCSPVTGPTPFAFEFVFNDFKRQARQALTTAAHQRINTCFAFIPGCQAVLFPNLLRPNIEANKKAYEPKNLSQRRRR